MTTPHPVCRCGHLMSEHRRDGTCKRTRTNRKWCPCVRATAMKGVVGLQRQLFEDTETPLRARA